jgi:hypothetical protein
MKRCLGALVAAEAVLVALLVAATASASTVSSIDPYTESPTKGVWYENDVRDGGTVNIVDLTGAGGDLENNQPLPSGAVLLTTALADGDKAEIGVVDDYGTPSDIFSTLSIDYSYHKASVTGGNQSAAPALKLAFWNEDYDAVEGQDGYVELIYEPYWNLGSNPTPDVWASVTIDHDTGLFWATGGFGQPNTFGGPPHRTLAQWKTVFDSEFGDAELVRVSIGVGSYNQGQLGYVDQVSISHSLGGSYLASYDFEFQAMGIPTASEWGLITLVLLLLATTISLSRSRRLA